MRINKFIAQASGLSRRAADQAIAAGQVTINGHAAQVGDNVTDTDIITLNGRSLAAAVEAATIILNKPVGYVCSRDGQGSPTVYELLPAEYQQLNIAGRLDKDSSGLLLLTTDGDLANRLTHPRYAKSKMYQVELDKPLSPADQTSIENGIQLEDGLSKLELKQLDQTGQRWQITMYEGRNRQIRRTFATLGYTVKNLHRTLFGPYNLIDLEPGKFRPV